MALPGASLKSIRTVKSHVQALAQCRNFLEEAPAAADASMPTRPAPPARSPRSATLSVGAIASSLAARIYDLKVLAKNIEDADHNTTRMLVFSREGAHPDWRYRAVHDRLPVPGKEPAGRALQGAWAGSRPTASTW